MLRVLVRPNKLKSEPPEAILFLCHESESTQYRPKYTLFIAAIRCSNIVE